MAFAKRGASSRIKVKSRTGKEYWMDYDNLQFMPEGLVYGVPVNPHTRSTKKTVWLYPENLTIVHELNPKGGEVPRGYYVNIQA